MQVDIFDKDYILIPINLGNAHWVAALINLKMSRIEYYDSMSGAGMAVPRDVAQVGIKLPSWTSFCVTVFNVGPPPVDDYVPFSCVDFAESLGDSFTYIFGVIVLTYSTSVNTLKKNIKIRKVLPSIAPWQIHQPSS